MEEPAQPDAFAAARLADAVHAVVPVAGAHQGQAVHAGLEAEIEAPRAMLVQRRRLIGLAWLEVEIVLARLEGGTVEERHLFVEDRRIARRLDVVRRDRGEPRPVVGDARAHALPGRREPPMLEIALDELPRRCAQDVLARQLGPRHGERHDILKLVAETIGAAGLIESRTRPIAARQGLVEQRAVQQDVHGAIRRLHLHRAQRLLPIARDLAMDGVEIGGAVALDQGPRLGGVAGLAEEEDDLGRAIALELDSRLQGRAGIEAGADALRQRDGARSARRDCRWCNCGR